MSALQATATLIAIGAWLGGCGSDRSRSTPADQPSSHAAPDQSVLLHAGRVAYGRYCTGCHGAEGDGRGEAAPFLHPRPRDFQRADFKFSSTRTGLLPTDGDLRRAIIDGLPGSAMTGYPFLPERTVDGLIAYIKTFSPRWTGTPAPEIPLVADPYRADRRVDESIARGDAIARGEAVYHGYATCWTCHPAYVTTDRINDYLVAMENPPRDSFRSDIFESTADSDTSGTAVAPPDFLRDRMRAGRRVADLYRSIAAGITGTAMPTWVDSMNVTATSGGTLVESADLWAMAYYVRSLIRRRPAKLTSDGVRVRDRRQPIDLTGVRQDQAVYSNKIFIPPPTETEVFNEDD